MSSGESVKASGVPYAWSMRVGWCGVKFIAVVAPSDYGFKARSAYSAYKPRSGFAINWWPCHRQATGPPYTRRDAGLRLGLSGTGVKWFWVHRPVADANPHTAVTA